MAQQPSDVEPSGTTGRKYGMAPWDRIRTDTFLTGGTDRRRFLTGIAAVGLAQKVSLPVPMHEEGGAIMARQSGQTVSTGYLPVPGARLYYEVAGSGPVLLLIPGGAADADIFDTAVGLLAENYMVVRYDPRGISRSRLDDAAADVPVELHADDARQVLEAVGDERAYVLGSSGGGVIGLALAERHPEVVRTLVAHEPPLLLLLPEDSERRRGGQEIYDVYRREGVAAAIQQFIIVAGLNESASEQGPEAQAAMAREQARMQQNVEYFFAHYLLPITSYVPDIAALREAPFPIVVGVGEDSGGQLAHDTALALAERLDTPPTIFPGDHNGFVTRPEAFAAKLRDVLNGR